MDSTPGIADAESPALCPGVRMSLEMETAARYRTHAEELRVIAETDGHIQTQRILLDIANDYERMAETFEQIERTNQSSLHPKPQYGSPGRGE